MRRRRFVAGHRSGDLVGVRTFGFTASGTVIDFGSPPAPGQWDVVMANANTVITSMGGLAAVVGFTGGQDAQVFARHAAGGEGSTLTVTLAVDAQPCAVVWTRWSSRFAAIASLGQVHTDGVPGNGSLTLNTPGQPAGSTVVGYVALHGVLTANQTAPVWGGGLSAVPGSPAASGAGASGCVGMVGYLSGAGAASLPVAVTSWTGDNASDRYTLAVALS